MHTETSREADASALADVLGGIAEPHRVLTRPIDRVAYASDASFYHLIPQAVVLAKGVEEVRRLFELSRTRRIPVTFRAAGTSLSGQAVTDGILVEVARHWRGMGVEDGGRKVRVQPGVIGGHVNLALKPYRAKMGPDPASINACMMGGILSNNSSGMCCGVAQNAYHTLDSLTFVLPSGTTIDTADPEADTLLRQREPRLAQGLLDLRQEILANPRLADRIRAKYKMKNTTGYSLNAFLDFERPVDIFRNLLVGAEGTLAFIAEAVLNTVPDLPVKYTGLLLFPSIHAACAAIAPLKDADAKALELMDRASLRSVEGQPGIPPGIAALPPEAAGLLAEFQAAEEKDRTALEKLAAGSVDGLALLESARFTHDAVEQALLWKIRQGLFPSVGAVRKRGTTVLIEDVVFPVERLADATVELIRVVGRHEYDKAIIFGHAKDGNLHLMITQSFNGQAEVDRYARFMDDMVRLVVHEFDGALKGEHGTGRNMAPFVETEWGADGLAIMRRLKTLVDPDGLLNPGVIVNPDPLAHLADLKTMPGVEEEVDKCIECGYCESTCPSQELTLTPRQRIVVRREMERLRDDRGSDAGEQVEPQRDPAMRRERQGSREEMLRGLEAEFPYMALDTCAADGLCATACPVSIDTGQLTKRFRRLRHPAWAQEMARRLAQGFAWIEPAARMGLRLGHWTQALAGPAAMPAITRLLRKAARGPFPLWSPEMPRPARQRRPALNRAAARAVYFPSCLTRVMGPLPGEPAELSLLEAFVAVAARAGKPIWIPEDIEGVCCGVPFSSKGYDAAHAEAVNRAVARFWEWSDGGRLSVVVDTSPCTYGLKSCRPALTPENQSRFDRLTILDGVAFVHDELLSHLTVRRRIRSAALHPVCSLVKMNLTGKLEAIARFACDEVTVPVSAGCCGFAGDRGFLFPELTASATSREAAEVRAGTHDGHFSSSRTCEIGMTRATGRIYRSYLFLLEEATRPS
jgi:D-lactate dehydrogenase